MRIRNLLQEGWATLAQAGLPAPALDAEVLLAHCMGMRRTALLTHQDQPVPQLPANQYRALLLRRMRHEPVAYLTGQKEFYGLSFSVNPHVLIPRPESELLVDAVRARFDQSAPMTFADIGTGSGCLAIALATVFPASRIIATDISAEALRVAELNAQRHHLAGRITFRAGDLLAPLQQRRLDAIVANLPYVTNDELAANPDLAYEPLVALRGAHVPATTYRQFLTEWRARGGQPAVFLEIHPNLRPVVENAAGSTATKTFLQDLAGNDRIAVLESSKELSGARV